MSERVPPNQYGRIRNEESTVISPFEVLCYGEDYSSPNIIEAGGITCDNDGKVIVESENYAATVSTVLGRYASQRTAENLKEGSGTQPTFNVTCATESYDMGQSNPVTAIPVEDINFENEKSKLKAHQHQETTTSTYSSSGYVISEYKSVYESNNSYMSSSSDGYRIGEYKSIYDR
jgi:hypothetical protein